MPTRLRGALGAALVAALALVGCARSDARPSALARGAPIALASGQVDGWSRAEIDAFLHGSMGAEVLPERMLRAFIAVNPDLFPRADLSSFGLIPDPAFGWPIGFSRRPVDHLGELTSVGVNCAACHVADVVPASGGAPVRVLGATSHFDTEAFFGAVTVATFRAASPEGMQKYLAAYMVTGEPSLAPADARQLVKAAWRPKAAVLAALIAADPMGAAGVAPGALHELEPADLRLSRAALEVGADLEPRVRGHLRLFHNVRAALHIPDQPPGVLPPASGPGRNDAFGLLSLALLGVPRPYAPVKYGVAWNLADRRWVHWDGNTQSPMDRNVLAALGLGAPLTGNRALLDVAAVARQTELSERIRAPRYPFAVDAAAAGRGAVTFGARCASCHEGAESDTRLQTAAAIGTDPRRAEAFTDAEAQRLNAFLARLEAPGYRPPSTPGLRATGGYWAPTLAGVWARAPYLHNGSVRTLAELLSEPTQRAATFRRGTARYDTTRLGYLDEGPYVLDTRTPGNSSGGHTAGVDLPAAAKRDLLEYLKTR